MSCLSCGRGFHDECVGLWVDGQECCCPPHRTLALADVDDEVRRYKDGVTTSAGRKRAATMYPLDRTEACEWQLLANCGGGKVPILGCLTGKQINRHHGPVKHTERNERGNIHLICAHCHNLWHAKNDPVYDEELFDNLLHDPRPMTPEEMLLTR